MQAALSRRYGPPKSIVIAEVPAPAPGPDEALVAVTAAAVTIGDARIRAADAPGILKLPLRLMFGITGPRNPILGMCLAGRLAAPAAGMAKDAPVIGMTGLRMGAHAEMVALPQGRIFPRPEGLTDVEAAAFFFGPLTAMDFLCVKSGLQPGQRLLVNGATGEVGVAALQIARHLGLHVTAVARAENHDFARKLGADDCINYRAGPIAGQWDGVLDLVGNLPYARARALLAPGGVLLPANTTAGQMIAAALRPRRDEGRRVTSSVTADNDEALRRLVQLHADGGFRPVVGRTFPFSGIAAAHALSQSGHKRGSCVVVMDQASVTAMAAKCSPAAVATKPCQMAD